MSKKLRFSDNGHLTKRNGRLPDSLFEKTPRMHIHLKAKTENQYSYMEAIENNEIILCVGPSGSGKTCLAVGMGIKGLKDEEFKRFVAIRPCIGVGRTMGYLPGEIEDKVAPYLRPILDELRKFLTLEEIKKLQTNNVLELGSLEHIRGITFENAFVILDEAQNCTSEELKVFITRLGYGSKFVINGDISRDSITGCYTQCDLNLPPHTIGAFEYQCRNLTDIEGVSIVELTRKDVVRHPLLQKILERGL